MNKELIDKVTELVMEELHANQGSNPIQAIGVLKIWPHHPLAKPLALTELAVPHEILDGQVRFSRFPTS